MSFYKIKSDINIIFLLVLIILSSYLSYIIYGGFGSGDDINFVLDSLNNKLFDNIKFHA